MVRDATLGQEEGKKEQGCTGFPCVHIHFAVSLSTLLASLHPGGTIGLIASFRSPLLMASVFAQEVLSNDMRRKGGVLFLVR